jgi:predicted  nucleic acid-binding Zn-ribbon protein
MKINFDIEHREKMLNIMDRYRNITEEYKFCNDKIKSLQDELTELTAKLQSAENTLQSIRDEEKEYMEGLHKIYGEFTLNDLWESL